MLLLRRLFLATLACLAPLTAAFAAPFAPGNLVIARVGSGTGALVNTGNPVFLDEYTPAGALVQTIALPTVASGSNKPFFLSGTATSEGFLSRSVDGKYLVLTGYAGSGVNLPGTTGSAVNRVVARIDAAGNIDTSTALADFGTGGNPRSAASLDGSAFWLASSSNGLRYATLGASTSNPVSTIVTNLRVTQIFANQLYASDASGTAIRLGAVGSGTPTTAGQITTNLPGFPTSTGSPYGFFFADLDVSVPGVDTLYVADDTANQIQKYSLVSGSWVATGTLPANGVRGLTAKVSGTTVQLYGVSGASGGANSSFLYYAVDGTGYNGFASGSPGVLATAAANTAFRGVALAPTNGPVNVTAPIVTSTTPISGTNGVATNSTIQIVFDQPTTLSSGWFSITGSVSGDHPATVVNGPAANGVTLVPTTGFAEGEMVSIVMYAAQIADASGTVHPANNATFFFNTAAATVVPIHTIQGSGATSPHVGQTRTIQGIVTASFQGSNSLGGFYVQAAEADYDSDPATSEGIFVFNTTFPVAAGDVVKVTGTVAEFGTAGVTQTELTTVTNVTKTGTAALPAAVEINLPFADLNFAERYEGMRATLPQTLTVTDNFDLGHFGEVFLSLGRLQQPTNVVAPGAPANAMEVSNFLKQVLLDDAVSTTYPDPTPFLADSNGRGLTRRAGSTATGVTGIFDQKFGSYIIEPTAPVTFTDDNPRANPPAVSGQLKVAIGNVLNFFNGNGTGQAGSAGGFPTSRGADTLAEYQRQRAKIVAGITALAPDIMGLTEVENDGYGPTSAIADIVNGLNAAAPVGTSYAYVNAAAVDIVTDVIHCAFIYRVETVAPVGSPAMLNDPSFNSVARNPLAQTFKELATGEKLTVSINHFKSKGSAASYPSTAVNADTGDGQSASNYVRKLQAQALVNWLATDPTGSGDPDFLIIGDLNAYAKEDPIAIIEAAGYVNLTEAAEGVGGYSYAFGGAFGHLDHALANGHLSTQVIDAATWHVNSDEPVYYDYNTENKSAAQQAINVGGAYRYSDHDPVLVGLALHPDPSAPSFPTPPASLSVDLGQPASFTVVAAGYPVPTLQWYKNNVLLPGETSPTLSIAATTMADAGTYSVIATNSVSTATASATLTVKDVTPPVLTLPAAVVVEATGPAGAIATFAATATDNVDPSVSVSYSIASGSVFPLGTTTVTATATDAAGNTSTGTFTVKVQDTTAPTLVLPASQTLEATSAAGAVANFAATASDLVSGDVVVSFSAASGSVFALGTTTVTATATDAAGNTASGSFTIKVKDTAGPVLTLPLNQVVEATSSAGAVVNFSATASDLVSGNVPVTFSPASGSTFAIGTTTVTATATDAAGNTSSGTFTVKVQDTTAPVITALTATPGNLGAPNHKMVAVTVSATVSESASAPVVTKIISVTSNEAANGTGDGNTAVDWEITGNLTLNLRAERSGNGSGRIYTITVQSKDAAGNASTKTVTVTVNK